MKRITLFSWFNYAAVLTLISLGLVALFTLLYMGVDQLGWGMVVTRQETREINFLALLYFSMGTYFRIGYGDQISTGLNCLLVGLEAMSSYLLGLIFLAQVTTAASERFLLRRLREELEGIPFNFSRRYQ